MIEWHDKAVDDFNGVIKRNPKNAHAYFRRAFSLKALGVSIDCIIFFSNLLKQLMILRKQRI